MSNKILYLWKKSFQSEAEMNNKQERRAGQLEWTEEQ
jgi:hypothetical protein